MKIYIYYKLGTILPKCFVPRVLYIFVNCPCRYLCLENAWEFIFQSQNGYCKSSSAQSNRNYVFRVFEYQCWWGEDDPALANFVAVVDFELMLIHFLFAGNSVSSRPQKYFVKHISFKKAHIKYGATCRSCEACNLLSFTALHVFSPGLSTTLLYTINWGDFQLTGLQGRLMYEELLYMGYGFHNKWVAIR